MLEIFFSVSCIFQDKIYPSLTLNSHFKNKEKVGDATQQSGSLNCNEYLIQWQ